MKYIYMMWDALSAWVASIHNAGLNLAHRIID